MCQHVAFESSRVEISDGAIQAFLEIDDQEELNGVSCESVWGDTKRTALSLSSLSYGNSVEYHFSFVISIDVIVERTVSRYNCGIGDEGKDEC